MLLYLSFLLLIALYFYPIKSVSTCCWLFRELIIYNELNILHSSTITFELTTYSGDGCEHGRVSGVLKIDNLRYIISSSLKQFSLNSQWSLLQNDQSFQVSFSFSFIRSSLGVTDLVFKNIVKILFHWLKVRHSFLFLFYFYYYNPHNS